MEISGGGFMRVLLHAVRGRHGATGFDEVKMLTGRPKTHFRFESNGLKLMAVLYLHHENDSLSSSQSYRSQFEPGKREGWERSLVLEHQPSRGGVAKEITPQLDRRKVGAIRVGRHVRGAQSCRRLAAHARPGQRRRSCL